MKDDINYRVTQWQPPPRPEWVQRINEEGSYLDIKSVVPLDEASLISHAKANTGLGDFGDDDWYEPFKAFIKALDEEANLSLIGRLMNRSDILMHLESRLRIEDSYRRHPEIEDEEITAPLLIIGSGRCGSSALQNLLSCDPDNGTLKHWETLMPVPPPERATYHTDPRIKVIDGCMTQWNRVTPEIVSMHEFGGDMPTELVQLKTLSFQATTWQLINYGFVPSYAALMAQRSAVSAYNYDKRVLKLLQWKNPRKHWLLKDPDSLRCLPDAFQVFPDLKLVWMHRDPLKALSSMVSLVGTLMWVRSGDRPDGSIVAQLTNPAGMAAMFDQAIDWIEQGKIPGQSICHIQYDEFVADQMATAEKLYRQSGMTLSDEARRLMATYLHEHPRDSRPTHKYSSGDSARLAEEKKLFERYQTFFKVKSEF